MSEDLQIDLRSNQSLNSDDEELYLEEEESDSEEDYYESGYDNELGYISKHLLNGEHIIEIENSENDFVQYEGDFVQGKRHGKGIYSQYSNNYIPVNFSYQGEFVNNLPEGNGVAYWYEEGVSYMLHGNFVDGLPDPKQPSTVTVEYMATENTPAITKTINAFVNHVSFDKPNTDNPNNLLDIYWQGIFELSGIMTDNTGANVTGLFDIHGNVLSQRGGRRSKKILNKKRRNSIKK